MTKQTLLILLLSAFALLPAMEAGAFINKPRSSDVSMFAMNCGSRDCHERITANWSKSMHGSSTQDKNPLVGVFYQFLSQDQFDIRICDNCHAPFKTIYRGEKKGNTDLYNRGVSCSFCHHIFGRNPGRKKGVGYYILDFLKPFSGPTKVTPRGSHDLEYSAIFKKSDICLGCHQEGEGDYIKGEAKTTCQQCHMPKRKGLKASEMAKPREKVHLHLFEGGHSQIMLGTAVDITGLVRSEGTKTIVEVTLENASRHTLPTGFPLRAAYLKVTALDNEERPIWTNYTDNPKEEDPDSYFSLFFKEGEELSAHYAGNAEPISDNRLKPAVPRKIRYEIPSGKVKAVKIQLFYRLLPPGVAMMLTIDDGLLPEILMIEKNFLVD